MVWLNISFMVWFGSCSPLRAAKVSDLVSGHEFGHESRSVNVANILSPKLELLICILQTVKRILLEEREK